MRPRVRALACLSVLLAACASPEPTAAPSTVSISLLEPATLVSLDTIESEGLAVLRAINTPIASFDAETGELDGGMAASVTSDDGTTWTIELAEGWTFHDGTPVTAQLVADTWDAGAYGPNAHATQGAFAEIAGFDAVAAGEAQHLSGVEVTGDGTLEVTLSAPAAYWAQKLSTPAYGPLPPAWFDDPEAFADAPVGTGPFRMDGTWEHDEAITLTAWDAWPGDRPDGAVDGVEFRIYADPDTATTDLLAGELDLANGMTPAGVARVREQLGEEHVVLTPLTSATYLAFPTDEPAWSDPRLRAALSMTVDREQLTTELFDGTRAPLHDVLPPALPGARDEVCDHWGFDPEAARALLDEAGGVPDPLTIWFNAGGGQEDWIEAVSNMWRQHLGVEEVVFESLQPAEYMPLIVQGEIDWPFRFGWAMDYAHPQNYLEPLLASWATLDAGGANVAAWADDDYDAALEEALVTIAMDEAIPAYQRAVDVACDQVPMVPVFTDTAVVGIGDGVDGVEVDPTGTIEVLELRAR